MSCVKFLKPRLCPQNIHPSHTRLATKTHTRKIGFLCTSRSTRIMHRRTQYFAVDQRGEGEEHTHRAPMQSLCAACFATLVLQQPSLHSQTGSIFPLWCRAASSCSCSLIDQAGRKEERGRKKTIQIPKQYDPQAYTIPRIPD